MYGETPYSRLLAELHRVVYFTNESMSILIQCQINSVYPLNGWCETRLSQCAKLEELSPNTTRTVLGVMCIPTTEVSYNHDSFMYNIRTCKYTVPVDATFMSYPTSKPGRLNLWLMSKYRLESELTQELSAVPIASPTVCVTVSVLTKVNAVSY